MGRIVAALREQIVDEIGPEETISEDDAGMAMSRAIESLNTINPRNPQRATLETAPGNWSTAVQHGAAAFLYRERAATLAATEPGLSRTYASQARECKKSFDDLGPKLMANRPASSGN